MKKVQISSQKPIFLASLLLVVFLLGLVIYVYVNLKEFDFLNFFCCLMCFIIPIAGAISVFFEKQPKNNLNYLKISPEEIIFVGDINGNTYEKHIMLAEIQSCQLQIDSHIEQNEFSRRNTQDLCEITFIIKNKNEEVRLSCNSLDTYWMKNIFSITKYIPNFSYVVNANTDCFKSVVESYIKRGKGLSLKETLKTFFNDKLVSEDKKIYAKILLCFAVFWLCFLVLVIGLIIRDVVKYSFS